MASKSNASSSKSTPLPARSVTPKVLAPRSVVVEPVTRLAAWPKSVRPADQGKTTKVETVEASTVVVEEAAEPVVENVTEDGVPETRTGDTTISESHAAARAADR